MREKAVKELGGRANAKFIKASSEDTKLPPKSVDFITAAQAFHWFDKARCRVEFRRVLKPRGRVALIWNSRGGSSDFTREYRQITKNLRGANPREDGARTDSAEFAAFFGGDYTTEHFAWSEKLNFDALWGNERSRSTSPTPDHPNYAPLETALRALFERYQRGGAVEYEYVTEVAVGILQ
jgi:SAM-dependent methyltransferase